MTIIKMKKDIKTSDMSCLDMYTGDLEFWPSHWQSHTTTRPSKNRIKKGKVTSEKNDIMIIDYGRALTKGGRSRDWKPLLIWPSETLKLKKSFKDLFDPNRVFSFQDLLEQEDMIGKRSSKENEIEKQIEARIIQPVQSGFHSNIPTNQARQYAFRKFGNLGVLKAKRLFENGYESIDSKTFESFNDGILRKLKGKEGERIMFSEPLGLSPKFRTQCLEQFFECYEMSGVLPCVDSIAGSYLTLTEKKLQDALIIHVGESGTSVLPFIGSNLRLDLVRTLDIGVAKMKDQFRKLVKLKYLQVYHRLTPRVFENLFTKHAFIARDYLLQLRSFCGIEYSQNTFKCIIFNHMLTIDIEYFYFNKSN